MTKRTLFSMLLTLLFPAALLAQDVKAKTLLDRVSAKYKAAKNIRADFSFSMKNAAGKVQATRKGTLLLQGDRYKVDLGSQQLITDGKTLWTHLVDDKEVQVSSLQGNEQAISPSKLFSGAYDKDYRYRYKGVQTIDAKRVEVIELTPLKPQPFQKVMLYVQPTTYTIVGGEMVEKSGTSYSYSISNVQLNTNIPESTFTFNPRQYPGVEVIDLR